MQVVWLFSFWVYARDVFHPTNKSSVCMISNGGGQTVMMILDLATICIYDEGSTSMSIFSVY